MIEVLATNITSPLGLTTEDNYRAVRAGESALSCYEGWRGIPDKFAASLFSERQMKEIARDGFSRFESLALHSIEDALGRCQIDITSPRTILILSTTKANIDELTSKEGVGNYLTPGATAKKIAQHLGMTSEHVVVCNACISGVGAQALAARLLSEDMYDTAIVCGADIVSPFVAAGFLSFKSLSPEPCRPFDIERLGLNLGEASSTIIFGKGESDDKWHLLRSKLNNDAYHVSAPSPTGEGSVEAIAQVLQGVDIEELGAVCVHGTATMFNDQMESKALARTALSAIPVVAIKGYYGHTLGAAGVLETVLTMRALEDGIVPAVRGYEEIGVGGKIDISNEERSCTKSQFLKIISGFGGCNGVLLYDRAKQTDFDKATRKEFECSHHVCITAEQATLDNEALATTSTGEELLKELYKNHIGDYAKFYKMDTLSRLALVATELVLQRENEAERAEVHDIILFNRTSSIVADRNHLATIESSDSFYPSPSIFLYTLPNIATGEIAIKSGYRGETSLYIVDHRDENLMEQIIGASLQHTDNKKIITGWIDCESKDRFEADIKILTHK
jgi:3-oxoacyl-[acyl-carrier-protein] synthase-1